MAKVDIIVRMIDQTGVATNKTIANLKKMAVKFAAISGGIVAVTSAFKKMRDEAASSELTQAKLNAVLQSTGHAAGMTAESLSDLSMEMSRATGVHFDLIKNAEAMMLTFTQVSSEVFPDAMKAAMDMAAVLDTDLKQPVIQIGKALNVTAGDIAAATRGMSAMSESGINFTQAQRDMGIEMVRTGDVLGFQKMILAELQVEFGGAAEMMGNTAAGSSEKLKTALSGLAGEIGTSLLPATTKANNALADMVNTMADQISAARELKEAGVVVNGYMRTFDSAKDMLEEFNEEQERELALLRDAAEAAGQADRKFSNYTTTVSAAASATKDLSASNESMFSQIMSLQSATDAYNEKHDQHIERLRELQAEQGKYFEGGTRWNQIQEEIDETNNDITALADAHEEASKRIVFSLLQQKMAIDGLQQHEFEALLAMGESMGILDKKTVETALLWDEQTTLMAEGLLAPNARLTDMIDKVNNLERRNGSSFDFFVNIHTSGSFSLPSNQGNVNLHPGTGSPIEGAGFASGTGGQFFTVPPGFPNDSFPVFLTSGEKVNVVPASGASTPLPSGDGMSSDIMMQMIDTMNGLPAAIARSVQFAVQTGAA